MKSESPSLKHVYNEFAATYDDNRGLFDLSEVLDDFYQGLGQTGQLLDLGCGSGEPVAKYFIEQGWAVTGVDFSGKMLKLASRYVPHMKRIEADIRELDFSESSFDAVTASYSLFHIPASEHAALFKKIYTWLSPGGKFLFTYATKDYTGHSQYDGYKNFMGQQLYYSHKKPEELRCDITETGYQIESEVYREIGNETFLWLIVCRPKPDVELIS